MTISVIGQTLGAVAAAGVITVLVTVITTIAAGEVFASRDHRVQLAQATAVAMGLVVLGALWWQKEALDPPGGRSQDATAAQTSGGVSFRGQHVTPAMISGATLRGAQLQGADLSGLNLRGQDLRGANAAGADLRRQTYVASPSMAGTCAAPTSARRACARPI